MKEETVIELFLQGIQNLLVQMLQLLVELNLEEGSRKEKRKQWHQQEIIIQALLLPIVTTSHLPDSRIDLGLYWHRIVVLIVRKAEMMLET